MSRRILAANMWPMFGFDAARKRYQRFLKTGRPAFERLIDSMVLYDEVVIPTQDFMSLTLILEVLGERDVLHLLSSGILKFLRLRGALAYLGNGGGIQEYKILKPDKTVHPPFAAVDEAVSWAIGGLTEQPKEIKALTRLSVKATDEVQLLPICEEIRRETYTDILGSPYLRAVFSIRNTDMDHLVGIGPNQVRIYDGSEKASCDEIDTVLRIAAANLELKLSHTADCHDTSTATPVGHVLKAKAQRCFGLQPEEGSFALLREMAGVPDIASAVLDKSVPLSKILALREGRDASEFREWFHKNCSQNPTAAAKSYAELLRRQPFVSSFSGRVIRFVVTTATGLISPILGGAAAAIDSFVLERILSGPSPKHFIDKLRQVRLSPEAKT